MSGIVVTPLSAQVVPIRAVQNGVTVLQRRADAFTRAPQWIVEDKPVAVAGGSGAPDYDLTFAWNVEILSDGRLVTLAPVGNRLYVFSPTGAPQRSLGRQGQGPGEIMAPTGMARLRGDTILIPDGANACLNWVDATKGFVRNAPLTVDSITRRVNHLGGTLRDGRLVMSSIGGVQQGVLDSVTRPMASVAIFSSRGDSARVVAQVPDLEVVLTPTRYRGRASTDTRVIRFTRQARAVAWDTAIATGSGDGYRIDVRDTRGTVRSSIRVPIARRAVTKAMRDLALVAALRRFEGPRMEQLVDAAESRRLEQVLPSADSLPPYSDWFVSPNRTLWVVDAAPVGAKGGAATAFRQDGAVLGRLTWSMTGTAVAFGDDRVVLRVTDDDDVVALQVHRFRAR
jgi:hypothetical protein